MILLREANKKIKCHPPHQEGERGEGENTEHGEENLLNEYILFVCPLVLKVKRNCE